MKLLHSADWHLDSPIQGHTPDQAVMLKAALLEIPRKVCALARQEQCDLMLLAGDLFDGPCTPESIHALKTALEAVAIPVFIAPGNHDPIGPGSPWLQEQWPKNVYIFKENRMVTVSVPALNCRVCGGAFTGPESDPLLEDFHAADHRGITLGLLHGDPTQRHSPYCPISRQQVATSGLDYLALGHIHKGGSFQEGRTLCLWPGCPMGRGFDEPGTKGVQIVTIENKNATARFVPLDLPAFHDLEVDVFNDPLAAVSSFLPPVGNGDFYRITLTGESDPPDLSVLAEHFPHFPNLILRDHTRPPLDIWANAGEDSLEGVYFGLLRQQLETADEVTRERILLAARISRQILENREVKLP